jgi:hypothetical protein
MLALPIRKYFWNCFKNCLERRAVIYTRRENQAGECGLGLPPHPLRPHQKAFRCPQGGLGQAGGQRACAAISTFLEEMKQPGAITHAQQLVPYYVEEMKQPGAKAHAQHIRRN